MRNIHPSLAASEWHSYAYINIKPGRTVKPQWQIKSLQQNSYLLYMHRIFKHTKPLYIIHSVCYFAVIIFRLNSNYNPKQHY